MRVCYICNEYPPDRHGGVGSFVYDLANSLIEAGHQVWVIGYSDRNAESKENGVNVIRIKKSDINKYLCFFYSRWKLAKTISYYNKKYIFDLIETPEFEGYLSFYNERTPLLVRYHMSETAAAAMKNSKVSTLIKWAEKTTITKADYIAAVSKHISKYSGSCFGEQYRASEILYNFVDSNIFKPRKDIVRESNKILFFGKISHNKGAHLLFVALPIIFEKNKDLYLEIVGSDTMEAPDGGSLLNFLIDKLDEKYRSRVRYVGKVERKDVPDMFSKAGICVFPSLAEAHSIAWLEAMACECPCVFSEIAGGREYVQNYESAIVCDPRNVKSLSGEILKLADNHKLRDILAVNARKEVLDRFEKRSASELNMKYYEYIIKQ